MITGMLLASIGLAGCGKKSEDDITNKEIYQDDLEPLTEEELNEMDADTSDEDMKQIDEPEEETADITDTTDATETTDKTENTDKAETSDSSAKKSADKTETSDSADTTKSEPCSDIQWKRSSDGSMWTPPAGSYQDKDGYILDKDGTTIGQTGPLKIPKDAVG